MSDVRAEPLPEGFPVGPTFSPDVLRKAIQDSMNADVTIPQGHTGGLVVVGDEKHVTISIATKVFENGRFRWDVGVLGSHAREGGNKVGFITKMTW